MSRNYCFLLTLAAMSTGVLLAACEADPSAPSRPRTPMSSGATNEDNAAKPHIEAPPKANPGRDSETPGRESSAARTMDPQVLTLQGSTGGTGGEGSGGGVASAGSADSANSTWSLGPIHGYSGPTGWN